jgi:hypothetical protein
MGMAFVGSCLLRVTEERSYQAMQPTVAASMFDMAQR